MVNKCGRCGYAKLSNNLSKEIGKCLMFSGLAIGADDPACKLFCSNPPYCTRCGSALRNEQVLIVDNKIYCMNCGGKI